MRLFYRLISVFFLLLTSLGVLAIDEHYAAPGLSGNQLAPDSTSMVMDTVYFNPTLKPLQTTFYACNAYLITSPVPYDHQPVYYEKPIYKKPDSCECSTINSLYQQYQWDGKDTSFAAYLYRTSGTVMRQGALDTLRMACNGGIDCSFLPSPLSLPPVLQCGVKNVCVNCAMIDTLYNQYVTKFPDALPAWMKTTACNAARTCSLKCS
jgi:hypothetical protein